VKRLSAILALLWATSTWAAPNHVKTVKDAQGWRLMVDGKPMMVFGMNWGYMPIGQNYAWVLWHQPDDVIEEALRGEMPRMKAMGINAIRQYPDIPPKWVAWIYDNYGIYTVVNHTMGRYGVSVNGAWIPNTDYSNPEVRAAITAEVDAVVAKYKDTRGVLMYLLGNENNYGLHWTSFEAENLPTKEHDAARAEPLYSLFGEIATRIKQTDSHHPIAIANGDLGYLDLIAKHGKDIDIMGSNVYRGASSRDLFDRIAKEFDRPFMYSEFGADAYDAKRKREAPEAQAGYLLRQWEEIYSHAHGKGRAQNAIGGLIFQWSDGWWKYKQTENLDVHDTAASWATGGYPHDFVEGQNNMNEEWFGIAAKDKPDGRGIHNVRPRTAYYVLKEAFTLNPYAPETTPERIRQHFGRISPQSLAPFYRADKAEALAEQNSKLRVSRLQLKLDNVFSAGSGSVERSSESRFDTTQSAYVDISANPTSDISARVAFNLLGNVAQNRLNPIFYENRGRNLRGQDGATTDADGADLSALERIALYQAEFNIEQPWFGLKGYYRVGHYHWGDEGDFFGLYQEAFYGPNIDIYNARSPLGMEFEGRQGLEGLKIAFGPEMYWGANPGFIAKYHRALGGGLEFTLMHHEDLGTNADGDSTLAIPVRRGRRTTLSFGMESGGVRFDIGGIMANSGFVGEQFYWSEETSGRGYRDSGHRILEDEIRLIDTLGTKARLTVQHGALQWYLHGNFKGLVADAGADPRQRFTGWQLNESGQGNHFGGLAGLAYSFGTIQIAPHFLFQKPLIGPMPLIGDALSDASGIYYRGFTARNQIDDPFAVISNREMIAGEFLVVFDPTPGTWFWQWDNNIREDADFAASLNFIYRHQPTSRDARFGVTEQGVFFPFAAAPPAQDLWEMNLRWIANPTRSVRLIGNGFVGNAQARGDDTRVITRSGADLTVLALPLDVRLGVAFNDWGPYDYHRDFNLTFPFQGRFELGYLMGLRELNVAMARFGVRGLFRTLDEHSEGFLIDPDDPDATGAEWEVGTYLNLDL
jgi:hypothetical protein